MSGWILFEHCFGSQSPWSGRPRSQEVPRRQHYYMIPSYSVSKHAYLYWFQNSPTQFIRCQRRTSSPWRHGEFTSTPPCRPWLSPRRSRAWRRARAPRARGSSPASAHAVSAALRRRESQATTLRYQHARDAVRAVPRRRPRHGLAGRGRLGFHPTSLGRWVFSHFLHVMEKLIHFLVVSHRDGGSHPIQEAEQWSMGMGMASY